MELDQFCILAKSYKGRACAALIQQVLGNKKIFVFGELLAIPSVASLKDNEEFCKYYATLELFAYGVYADYIENRERYLELSEQQERKLKLLSIVTYASQNVVLPYKMLHEALGVTSTRDLEDLLIEAIYQKLAVGKLDHKSFSFKVHSFAVRDVPPSQLQAIIDKLKSWRRNCESGVQNLDDVSRYMQEMRQQNVSEQEAVQLVIQKVKATMRDHSSKASISASANSQPFFRPFAI